MSNSGSRGAVTPEQYAWAMEILRQAVTTETPAPAPPVPGGMRGEGLIRGGR